MVPSTEEMLIKSHRFPQQEVGGIFASEENCRDPANGADQ
jgi:hypothetical protein